MSPQEYIQSSIRIEWKMCKLYKNESWDPKTEPSTNQLRDFYKLLVSKSGLSSDEIKRLIIDEELTHHQVFDWLGVQNEKATV